MNKAEYDAAHKKKRAAMDAQLEEHLKTNKELREVIEKHPEKRELYIEKILDSSPVF